MPRLLTLVWAFAEQLPQPIYVQYGHNNFDCKKVESFGFLSEVEFGKHMSKAAVIVLHGGANQSFDAAGLEVMLADRGS